MLFRLLAKIASDLTESVGGVLLLGLLELLLQRFVQQLSGALGSLHEVYHKLGRGTLHPIEDPD